MPRRMKNIIIEFKEFAVKGNVFDMAIGIIIGTAFSKVVSSLVSDMIMPLISYFTGGVNFSALSIVIKPEVKSADGAVIQQLESLNYGSFLQVSIDFIIVAFSIFIVIKFLNSLKRKADNVYDSTVCTPKNIELLSEIRNLLKEKRN
jgi:large conductance mechanosensitive channel